MRGFVKYLLGITYQPVLQRYLAKTRRYKYADIRLEIPAGVFHPGFFFSTRFLLSYITGEKLSGLSVLELGAGSGLLSAYAAGKGANVTATDISPLAVNSLKKNMSANKVAVEVLHSDLFTDIPGQSFDLILLNPPYYQKNPSSFADYAWYCGKNGEYFFRLFESLTPYVGTGSKVLMVLCEGCDLEMIRQAAASGSWRLECVATRSWFIEKHYIFKIEKLPCNN